MGFDCELLETGTFTYVADLGNGLHENEIDHVFIGVYKSSILPSPQEVADYTWKPLDATTEDLGKHPEKYTVWLRIIFSQHRNLLAVSSPSRP